MKFHFCGDQDCPDWFLTQISTLSRLSSVKAKILSQHVARHLMGHQLDSEKISSLVADLKLSSSETQSLLSAVDFVLRSASRFHTDEEHLRAELQQVGLPKETAAALAKVHQDSTSSITRQLIERSLRLNRLEDVSCGPEDPKSPWIDVDLVIKNWAQTETVSLTADRAKLQILLAELESVRELMDRHGLTDAGQ